MGDGFEKAIRTAGMRKIKNQMLLYMVLIIIVISTSLSISVYRQARLEMEDTYGAISKSNLKAYSEQFDIVAKNIVLAVREALFEDELLGIMQQDNPYGNRQYDNINSAYIRRRINALLLDQPKIKGVLIFDDQGRYLGVDPVNSQYYNHFYSHRSELQSNWSAEAAKANGKEVFYGYNVITEEQEEISFVKALRDTTSWKQVATVVVILNKSILQDLVRQWQPEKSSYVYMVLDEAKNDYLVTLNDEENVTMYGTYLKERKGGTPEEASNHIFMTHHDGLTGWTFISGVEKAALSSISALIQTTAVNATVLIIFAGVLLSFLSSGFISKPLERLKKAIHKFYTDNQPITEEFAGRGEIDSMGNIIKDTVNRSLELNNRVMELQINTREAEFRALQAQINPHFLYNTLDSLYFMAILNNVNEIAEITAALSSIFRKTLNKGNDCLTLEEELEYIREYMLIQNFRFSDRFQLDIHCDFDPHKCYLPKFIVQPFVENAVIHGFEPKREGPCHITVVCHKADGDLIVTVTDNGVGIEDMREVEEGYAIRNVDERIRLLFGDEYGVAMESQRNKGTSVVITVPFLSGIWGDRIVPFAQ